MKSECNLCGKEAIPPFDSSKIDSTIVHHTCNVEKTKRESGFRKSSNFIIQNKKICKACGKVAYQMESLPSTIGINKDHYHKACFKCKNCKAKLQMQTYKMINFDIFCKNCFVVESNKQKYKSVSKRDSLVFKNTIKTPKTDTIETKKDDDLETIDKKIENVNLKMNEQQKTIEALKKELELTNQNIEKRFTELNEQIKLLKSDAKNDNNVSNENEQKATLSLEEMTICKDETKNLYNKINDFMKNNEVMDASLNAELNYEDFNKTNQLNPLNPPELPPKD